MQLACERMVEQGSLRSSSGDLQTGLNEDDPESDAAMSHEFCDTG